MYFENEKDDQNLSSQDTNWDDVLSNDNDLVIDLEDQNQDDIQGLQPDTSEAVSQATSSGIQGDIIVEEDVLTTSNDSVKTPQKIDDDYDVLASSALESADSYQPQSINSPQVEQETQFAYESDDEELARILSGETPSRQGAFDAFGNGQEGASQEQGYSAEDDSADAFDLDSQLAQILSEGEIGPDTTAEFKRRKSGPMDVAPAKQKSSSGAIVLVGVLVLFLFLGYTAFKFVSNKIASLSKNLPIQVGVEDEIKDTDTTVSDIPVVSESEITAEINELIGDEKKEKLDVDTAGRVNPFMPADKYIVVPKVETKPIVIVNTKPKNTLDLSGITMPPSEYGELDETADSMSDVAVSGIMYDAKNPSAIITFDKNDYFVQKGDRLGDYKVLDILPNQVAISYGRNIYKARVGEQFNVHKFYGSAQFIPRNQGGGRHYELVVNDDADDEGSTDAGSGYVSPDDVEVKSRSNKEKKSKN